MTDGRMYASYCVMGQQVDSTFEMEALATSSSQVVNPCLAGLYTNIE
jgi:hypothetical protein